MEQRHPDPATTLGGHNFGIELDDLPASEPELLATSKGLNVFLASPSANIENDREAIQETRTLAKAWDEHDRQAKDQARAESRSSNAGTAIPEKSPRPGRQPFPHEKFGVAHRAPPIHTDRSAQETAGEDDVQRQEQRLAHVEASFVDPENPRNNNTASPSPITTEQFDIPEAEIVDPKPFLLSRCIPESPGGKVFCFGVLLLITIVLVAGIVCGSGTCSADSTGQEKDAFVAGDTTTNIVQQPTMYEGLATPTIPPTPSSPTLASNRPPLTPTTIPPTPDTPTTRPPTQSPTKEETFTPTPTVPPATTTSTKACNNSPGWSSYVVLDQCVRTTDTALSVLDSQGFDVTIPTELGLLTALTSIVVSSSAVVLKGTIPSEIGNLTALENLSMSYNQLSGSLPTELFRLSKLTSLELSGNDISSGLPTEVGLLTNMRWLFFGDDVMLGGTIPSELGMLTALSELYLGGDNLRGSLPTELGWLGAMVNFQFKGNYLSGGIPTEMGWMTSLSMIALLENELSGPIPSELGLLGGALKRLALNDNRLTGSIPTELGLLTHLYTLHLKGNRLTGTVPASVCSLTTLNAGTLDVYGGLGVDVVCPDDCAVECK